MGQLVPHRPLALLRLRRGHDLKAKLALGKAYGFRCYEAYKLAYYHTLGQDFSKFRYVSN